jgi:hypoxanthine-DNA glycosylase
MLRICSLTLAQAAFSLFVLASVSAKQRTQSTSHVYRFIITLLVEAPVILARLFRGESTIRPINTKTSPSASDIKSSGFAPIAREDARVLILGSLPGQRSIQEAEYYAHPQNAFWSIMRELFSVEGDYEQRCEQLTRNGVAMWDVLARSVRPGSLDADIRTNTSEANDFKTFFQKHRRIELVCFNGQKAAQLYERFVAPGQTELELRFITMPSTSPAYASLSFAEKLEIWRAAIC